MAHDDAQGSAVEGSAMRVDDADTLKWVKRLERVLKDCPNGVSLFGMDGDLYVGDMEAIGSDDLHQAQIRFGGRCPFLLSVKSGRSYTDSGGW